jgi:dihydrolipoamide dehydrogenase
MHDLVVLGGGPGGYATAFRAAARGLDVALIEADKVGGTCTHRGCIPSKAILYVSEVLEEVQRSDRMGLKLAFEGLDGDAFATFRQDVIDRVFKGLSFLVKKRTTHHQGRGTLVRSADGRVAVDVVGEEGATTRVEGRHVVLATGSVVRSLPGVEIDGEVVQTSDEALWFTEPPRRAVVIGAGAIGMEFASMWAPMGTEVTVVEALDRVLPLEDADCSAAVEKAYLRRGIEVLTSASVTSVERDGDVARVSVEVDGAPRTLEADRVLVAIGRAPNTGGVGAAELGVLDERGFVVTDEWGATTVEGLWAAGDVRPTLALAHAAFAEGCALADRIAQVPHTRPVDHTHTPRVTYCHPEVASVGLTEAQARERLGDDAVATTTASLRHNAKGILAGSDGFVKVVHGRGEPPVGAPGDGGPVLGVHIVGPHATDIIAEATLATAWEAMPAELAAITHAHPSLYEAMGEAFQSAAGLPFHEA